MMVCMNSGPGLIRRDANETHKRAKTISEQHERAYLCGIAREQAR